MSCLFHVRHSLESIRTQFSELSGRLQTEIVDYQNDVISTVILQDAESHNWGDQRPFYEVRTLE